MRLLNSPNFYHTFIFYETQSDFLPPPPTLPLTGLNFQGLSQILSFICLLFLICPIDLSATELNKGKTPPSEGACSTVEITISDNHMNICDFTFTVTIEIVHDYTSSHTYTIETTYPEDFFNYENVGPLQNVSYSNPFPGLTTASGTVVSVVDPQITPTVSVYTLTFKRNASWPGIIKTFGVRVLDAECTEPIQEETGFNLTSDDYVDLRPHSETVLSELIDDGVISFLPFTDSELPSMLIDDELVIDLAVSWTGDIISSPAVFKNIFLMPGARIRIATVQPYGLPPNLFISEANIGTCPDSELAEGFVIDPLNTSGFQFTQLTIRNSTVSDCRFAVNAKPGSSFRLENSDFINNYIGVDLDMSVATPSLPHRVRIDGFAGNTFFTAPGGALKPTYSGMPEAVETRGYCGVRMNEYEHFNVFGTPLLGGNSFARLANGIIANNSTGNIGNMSFSDMNSVDGSPVYPYEGYGIHLTSKRNNHWFNIGSSTSTLTIDSCKTGVWAAGYAGKVENAVMTRLDIGVDWSRSQYRDITIKNDTITARRFGVRSALNEPVHSISTILSNVITVTGQAAGTIPVSGIRMDEIGLGFTPAPNQAVPLKAGTDGWEVDANTVTMSRGGQGIFYRNGVSGLLENNTVNDMGLTGSPGPYDGIFVEGSMFSQINFNDVTRSTNAGGNAASRAIRSSAGFANGFTCNCVDNTGVGMQFFDMADFSDNVRGNKLNNHDETGLQLGDQNISNAYIGTQYHRGNEWDLSAIPLGGYGAVYHGSADMAAQSRFFVDPNEKSGALSPDVDPVDWFDEQVTPAPSFDCANGCIAPTTPPPFEGEGDVPTALDEAAATEKLYPDVYEDETNWRGAYRLYRKILRRPAIESYATEFEDFKLANDSLSTGRLAFIAEAKATLFALTALEDSLLEQYRLAWYGEMEYLFELDSLRHAGDTTISHAQYDTAVQYSTVQLAAYQQYLDSLRQERLAKIEYLLALNAAVTTSLTPAYNHKAVNTILLNFLQSDTLATGDLAALESIAETCPLEGGDAVYEARSFASYFSDKEYDDYELCPVSQRHAAKAAVSDLKLTLYPNPTSGKIFWTGASGEHLTIQVFNSLGQLQLDKQTTSNYLDLSPLPQGMYFLKIVSATQKVRFSGSVSLLK